jgi:porphobilinogen synthase
MTGPIRPRRLRLDPLLRTSLQRVVLRPADFVVPVFVCEGDSQKREVPSMPGIFQMSVDVAIEFLKACIDVGIVSFIAFGVIDRRRKDANGSEATNADNVVCRLVRTVRDRSMPIVPMTDLCLCEYTSHGHCGPLTAGRSVDNDQTLPLLVAQALNHARAGSRVIAPSGMMDNAVAAIRSGLDADGFSDVAILSYAVKYASAYYGPFRDAADSAPSTGDRRGYQMDPARGVEEALREAMLDVEQGADMIMVKPAGPYLDVLRAVRQAIDVPTAAYQVSGEYAMIEAAARNGWIDRDRVVLESLTAIKRAGADLILTYYAPHAATMLR